MVYPVYFGTIEQASLPPIFRLKRFFPMFSFQQPHFHLPDRVGIAFM